jgi:hypothetical protein
MNRSDRPAASPASRIKQLLLVLALIVAAALACDALSILLVHIPGLQTQHSANAGNAFGAAAASGSVVVLYYMARTMRMQELETVDQGIELRLQRKVLEKQCELAERTSTEMNRTAEAMIRSTHISLLRMAMDDPDLAATWPMYDESAPPVRNKQYMYVNAVLSLHLLAYQTGYSEKHVEATLRSLFAAPVWREFWERNRANRATKIPPETAEDHFSTLADRAYQAAVNTTDIRTDVRRPA